jgi:hypothetical protein
MTACTIVVNSYNYGRFLRRCIDSCLAQTIPVEVVAVDDGSSDDSCDVLRSYGNDITMVEQRNCGQGMAVNAGVAVASAPVILMLDSDDWMFPHRAERAVEILDQGYDWLRHGLRSFDEVGGLGKDVHNDRRITTPSEDVDQRGATPGTMSGLAFTADLLQRIGPIPAEFRIYPDGYLKFSAAYLGTCATGTEVLGVRRLHTEQASKRSTDVRQAVATRIRLRSLLAQRAASLSSSVTVRQQLAWWQRRASIHQACLDGCSPSELWTELRSYARALQVATFPASRKVAFLGREALLTCAPKAVFPRLWWLTSDGRPAFHPST